LLFSSVFAQRAGEEKRMTGRVVTKIKTLDFAFENSLVRIAANRSIPEIKLAGLSLGPFEEGNEYEVYHWVAQELEKSGIARFRQEESMDAAKLYKIQWTERVQTAGQMSTLPEEFYPKYRRYLSELKKEVAKSPEKMREYERVKQLIQDIVNSRLKKIIAIASGSTRTEQILKNLTSEERFLFEQLYRLVNDWRTQILEYERVEE
jgi:hypothetical protein